ncbi:MAG: SWIM zinc finger family protein [Chloroflexi bacterium]|nr:SWIM zinc finger family protein [Chloroflexota bacterium]
MMVAERMVRVQDTPMRVMVNGRGFGRHLVASRSRSAWHLVDCLEGGQGQRTMWVCTCEDFTYRGVRRPCAHVIAAQLAQDPANWLPVRATVAVAEGR